MQDSNRFTQGWKSVLIAACLTHRWLLTSAILIMALGIMSSTREVQAQDGGTRSGQRLRAAFVLQVDTSDPKLNNLCIGQSVLLPVTVQMQTIEFTGSGDVGSWTVRSVEIDPVVANPSIVSAVQSSAFFGDPAPNAPFRTGVTLTGQEAGRTTITINATVQSSIVYSLDEEVALPIPVTSQANPVSVPVRVVPCQIRLDSNSLWVTTIEDATALLNGNINTTLTADASGIFRGEATVRWQSTVNRRTGCLATNDVWRQDQGVSIRGEVTENDRLRLTLNFQPLGNGGVLIECPVPNAGSTRTCADHPDGVCNVNAPNPTYTPAPITIEVPITGGTLPPVDQRLDGGNANGRATITVTPITSQGQ